MGRTAADRRADLIALYRQLNRDHGCPLAATRTTLVFGTGNADADLMFVGEAPGANEDRQGKPFVGRAGQLLDTMLAGIGLDRADAFIANVLKCRPPGNRDPLPEEIAECEPYLMRQVELIEPKVICTLGNFATKLLSGSSQGITRVHGRAQAREIAGIPLKLYPLFHPAAALRSAAVTQQLREDFARLPALLEDERRAGPARAGEPAPREPAPREPGVARMQSAAVFDQAVPAPLQPARGVDRPGPGPAGAPRPGSADPGPDPAGADQSGPDPADSPRPGPADPSPDSADGNRSGPAPAGSPRPGPPDPGAEPAPDAAPQLDLF